MSVDKEEVRRIARLAHLEYPRIQDKSGEWIEPHEHLIDEQTLESLANDMTQVLNYVRTIDELDLTHVTPTSHGVLLETVMRDDVAVEELTTDDALRASPQAIGHQIAVPKIVE